MRNTRLILLALLGACALPPPVPPTAEFLVSAGDQTYWVRSDNSGLKIRGSPLILARTGGRYYEIFVGEIDRSFPRALLSGERTDGVGIGAFDGTDDDGLHVRFLRLQPSVSVTTRGNRV